MVTMQRMGRTAALVMALASLGACSSAGALGDILGGVLGGGGGGEQQVAGTIRGVDSNNRQISLQQSNGQAVAIHYDNNTRVIYQNRNYPVTALEYGDQVTVAVQSVSGGYYTDSIQVVQSVSSSSGGSVAGNVQSLQGYVRSIDHNSGYFTLETGGTILTVTLPYNTSRNDVNRFHNLRNGDHVRLYGVFVNNTRVELRQFY